MTIEEKIYKVKIKAEKIAKTKGISVKEAMHEARNEVQKDIIRENSNKKPI